MVNMCTILLISLLLSSSLADTDLSDCNTNKCYQTVNTSYTNLLDLVDRFNSTTSKAEIPQIYDIQSLKNALDTIVSIQKEIPNVKTKLVNAATKLNSTEKNTNNKQKIVDELLRKLSDITDYNNQVENILTEATKRENILKELLPLAENASQTCQQAHHKYTQFKKIIDDIIADYSDVSNKYNTASKKVAKVNSDVRKTFGETVAVKNKLDGLKLPVNVADDYLLSMESNISRTINYLKNNSEILKEMLAAWQKKWNFDVQQRADEVAKNISRIKADLNIMNDELNKYEQAMENLPNFRSTVNNESRDLLQQLKNELDKLENVLRAKNFTEEERQLLLGKEKESEKNMAEFRKLRRVIKEYRLILDALYGINIKEIRKQINILKNTISLIQEWTRLRDELIRLRANRDQIVKINCTAPSIYT